MNYNEILKQFTETPAINIGGHFGVVDNNKRNVLARKDVNVGNIMYAIMITHPELANDAEKLNAVREMVIAEVNANVKTR